MSYVDEEQTLSLLNESAVQVLETLQRDEEKKMHWREGGCL